MSEKQEPQTLIEACRYFADADVALTFVAALRWPDGPTCPECQGREVSFLATRRLWKCKGCKKQFSVKVGTIFEDSPIPLQKWLPALWSIANCKNGISSYELSRAIGVTQKTAWFMLHRIRLAMQSESFPKLRDDVEIDESFIGGLSHNMHKLERARKIHGRYKGKTTVLGMLQRTTKDGKSRVRAKVVRGIKRRDLLDHIRQNVRIGSNVYTDDLHSYNVLPDMSYYHHFINHAECYVRGKVHTNGLENFWSLLKRAIKGTYVSVEPFHLCRYVDEQAFRFNERSKNDRGRFVEVLKAIVGKRLTYDVLIGKTQPQTC